MLAVTALLSHQPGLNSQTLDRMSYPVNTNQQPPIFKPFCPCCLPSTVHEPLFGLPSFLFCCHSVQNILFGQWPMLPWALVPGTPTNIYYLSGHTVIGWTCVQVITSKIQDYCYAYSFPLVHSSMNLIKDIRICIDVCFQNSNVLAITSGSNKHYCFPCEEFRGW